MEKSLVKNAADAEQVKEAKKRSKSEREQALDDLEAVCSTPHGRRTIWRYLSLCGMFRTSYYGDVNQALFLEGQRNIGLQIVADLNEADPSIYLKMMQESTGAKNV